MPKFTTLSPHIGDRSQQPYQFGETREVDDENMVRHLIDDGTLGGFDAKAEKAFLSGKGPSAEPQTKIDADNNAAEVASPEKKAA